ncbi:hypothetical protein KIW84_061289 [Lathyrus oleraceus]|uniref:Uncharacterized protein n=1 Tax=Pisum sativum TaxID=3888 RepID=A0A9D4W3W2_PEA|nr:hypothetical protein KIW84_061289 [Pisum sativum]
MPCSWADSIFKDVIFNEQSFPYPYLFSDSRTSAPQSSSHICALIPTITQNHSPNLTHASITSSSITINSSPTNIFTPQSPLLSPNNFLLDLIPALSPSSTTSSNNSPSSSFAQVHLSSPDTPQPITAPANTHPMITRSKDGIVCPRLHPTLLLAHAEPRTVRQALSSPTWLAAMTQEYDALLKNKTWSLVPLPPELYSPWLYPKDGSDPDDRRSTSGACVLLGKG